MENTKKQLPWDEIVDRLYHRQETKDIMKDLSNRGIVGDDPKDSQYVHDIIEGMKTKIEAYRINNR